jgi:tripartite-type tricarboxylate transporter receptor subunit TctC
MKRVVVAALVAHCAFSACAQYPGKPIHLIVPFPAAGAADLAARIISAPLSQSLGQAVIVENRPGADGAIAAEAVMKSAPDGYTLLFATNTPLNAAVTLRKNPPYDAVADFTPITMLGRFGSFLVVHEGVPAKTAPELIGHIRANPGKLNYATANTQSILATAQMKRQFGLDIVQVPYKGDAPALTDLVAGRVHLMVATGISVPYVKDGRLRALATLLPRRSAMLPDVPTMEEAGLAGLTITPWAGLFGPAKLPRGIVDRLAREMKEIMARPDIREALDRLSFEASSSSPEEMASFLSEQLRLWRTAIDEAGIARD